MLISTVKDEAFVDSWIKSWKFYVTKEFDDNLLNLTRGMCPLHATSIGLAWERFIHENRFAMQFNVNRNYSMSTGIIVNVPLLNVSAILRDRAGSTRKHTHALRARWRYVRVQNVWMHLPFLSAYVGCFPGRLSTWTRTLGCHVVWHLHPSAN